MISAEEKLRRQRVNASVRGTNAMEGLHLDLETTDLMRRFEEGELSREELSEAIDAHVGAMAKKISASRSMAGVA